MNIQPIGQNQTTFTSEAKFHPNLSARLKSLIIDPRRYFECGDGILERLTNMVKVGSLKKLEEDVFELGDDTIRLTQTEYQRARNGHYDSIYISHGKKPYEGSTTIDRSREESDSHFDAFIDLLHQCQ